MTVNVINSIMISQDNIDITALTNSWRPYLHTHTSYRYINTWYMHTNKKKMELAWTHAEKINQWINQRINNQWFNQWINDSIDESINNEWINQGINESISFYYKMELAWTRGEDQSMNQWIWINQWMNEWTNESTNQSMNESIFFYYSRSMAKLVHCLQQSSVLLHVRCLVSSTYQSFQFINNGNERSRSEKTGTNSIQSPKIGSPCSAVLVIIMAD